jgi:DNA-binding NarL/FixJ family response regulator
VHFFDGELYAVVLIAFSELSAESTPENIARCARLYGGVRPYLSRFFAVTAPHYQQLLEGGIQGLRYMLGQTQLDRIADQAPRSWPKVMAEADAFAAEQLEAMPRPTADTAQPPAAAERILEAMRELSDRERELLELVLTGITDKQIAAQLELRPNTVRSYNSRLFRKFGVASRTELLALMRTR